MCPKNAFLLYFAKFCVSSLWNSCFCSLIAFRGGARFRPDFWAVSNLDVIWSIFCFWLVVLVWALEGLAPHQPNPSFCCFFGGRGCFWGFLFLSLWLQQGQESNTKIRQKQIKTPRKMGQKPRFSRVWGHLGGEVWQKKTPPKRKKTKILLCFSLFLLLLVFSYFLFLFLLPCFLLLL